MDIDKLNDAWTTQKRPAGLSRSYEFESYDATRQFLDDLADLSERVGYYPNLNFNRTQVKVTIEADADGLCQRDYDFAVETDALLTTQQQG